MMRLTRYYPLELVKSALLHNNFIRRYVKLKISFLISLFLSINPNYNQLTCWMELNQFDLTITVREEHMQLCYNYSNPHSNESEKMKSDFKLIPSKPPTSIVYVSVMNLCSKIYFRFALNSSLSPLSDISILIPINRLYSCYVMNCYMFKTWKFSIILGLPIFTM